MSVEEYVERSRARQGLPPRVEDPRTLRLLARLLLAPSREEQERSA